MNACGDSRLRGLRSRKPIGFRQWVVHVRTALIWGTAAFEPKKNWSDKKITELSQIFEHPIACKQ